MTIQEVIVALERCGPEDIAIGIDDTGMVVVRVEGVTFDVHDKTLGEWLISRAAQWRREHLGEREA